MQAVWQGRVLPLGRTLRRGLVAVAVLLIVGGSGGLYLWSLAPELPALRAGKAPPLALATEVYTADGKRLARFYRENRTWASYDQISPALKHALLATEDHRFWGHPGIDVWRLAGATWSTFVEGDREGASTLTMQLVRNLYPEKVGQAPTIRRKLREIGAALKVERQYSKKRILTTYLNTVSFGLGTYGIQAAAETYFNTSAARLDTTEAALLVALLKGPTRYNPVRHPERARHRRNVVLGQMAKQGYLTKKAARRLQKEPLRLNVHRPSWGTDLAPHFAEHVRARLVRWAHRNGYDPYADGLRVHTTLDSRVQKAAKRAVARQAEALQAVVGHEWSQPEVEVLSERTGPYERARKAGRFTPFAHFWQSRRDLVRQYVRRTPRYRRIARRGVAPDSALKRLLRDDPFMDSLRTARTRLEAGLVALEPRSGRVKAWVGGRSFQRNQYDHVALARRQAGSTFKPFVYAAAIDEGFSPTDRMRDVVHTYRFAGGRTWTPRNAHGSSGARLTLREGLTYSVNTVTARLMAEVGPHAVAQMARRLGIRSKLREVPSLALGTSPVTLLEMTSAYATLATRGVRHPPVTITRIEDREGHVLASFAPRSRKAVPSYTAYATLDMMREVVRRGTGARLRYDFGLGAYDLAGKTGTTQHGADGWFIGLHPQLAVGSWVGFSDQHLTFRSDHWGQGGHNALNLVGDFYRRLVEAPALHLSKQRFQAPPGYRTPPPQFTSEDAPDSMQAPTPPLYARDRYEHAPAGVRADQASSQTPTDPDADVERRLRETAGQAESTTPASRAAPSSEQSLRPPPVSVQRNSGRSQQDLEARLRRQVDGEGQ